MSAEAREGDISRSQKSIQEVSGPTGLAEPWDLRIGAEIGWAGPTVKE